MKKILTIVASLAFAYYVSHAASVSVTVAGGGVSNVISGSLLATDFVLASAANNVATLKLHDSPSAVLTNVVPSYINTGVYATNYITSYTNYFGVQNNFTNVALVQYSITNAATTNYYPILLALNAGTNSTIAMNGVAYQFTHGLTITNGGAASATLSIQYVQ